MLQAASRLMAEGRSPSLDEIAAEALVSRATAYRYFANVEALLVEASLDIAVPDPGALFRNETIGDPVARLERVDGALQEAIVANEAALRVMLMHSLQRPANRRARGGPPPRQNRRTPLIEAALEPARKELRPAALPLLRKALALVIGTEAAIVCKDVLELDEVEARRVRRWAIRALVDAARKKDARH